MHGNFYTQHSRQLVKKNKSLDINSSESKLKQNASIYTWKPL